MPNHVTNRIVVTGDESYITQLRDLVIKGDDDGEPCFDFNTLIRMPQALKDAPASSAVNDGLAILGYRCGYGDSHPVKTSVEREMTRYLKMPWAVSAGISTVEEMKAALLKRNPDCVGLAEQALDNVRNYGYMSWYPWACNKWGTKWNSYAYREVAWREGIWEFTFQTAWDSPSPVLVRMFTLFPLLTFRVDSFDEGWGFAETTTYSEGRCRTMNTDPDDKVAMATMYERVYGCPPEDDEE